MSGGLPYPVSNNRASYPASDHSHSHSSSYPAGPSTNPTYPYPSYPGRSAGFDTNHGRADTSVASSSLSGMFHHAEHDQPQSYSRQGHPVDAFSHHPGPAHPREQVWQYAQSVPEAPRTRYEPPPLEMGMPREYRSTVSHPPPVVSSSHGHSLLSSPTSPSSRSAPSGAPAGRSRREKPRLELAPDQPLTTQGKPRTRVYVACVQW